MAADAVSEASAMAADFDFQSVASARSEAGKTVSSTAKNGKSSTAKNGKRKICSVIDREEPVQGKQVRCGLHRRAIDILKQTALAHATADQDTPESAAFKEIFGDGTKGSEGKPDIASEVLGNYLRANPDIEDKLQAARRSTKKRVVNVNLASFVHRRGLEHSVEDESKSAKVDLELFQRIE